MLPKSTVIHYPHNIIVKLLLNRWWSTLCLVPLRALLVFVVGSQVTNMKCGVKFHAFWQDQPVRNNLHFLPNFERPVIPWYQPTLNQSSYNLLLDLRC